MKTYQSYKPSGVEWIGDIPNEWTISRLKWITNIENSGVWGEDNEFTNSVSVPIPTTGQLSIDGKWFYDKMNVRHLSINEWNKYKCIEGDIVVVKSSGSSTNIITGKCGFITNEDTEKFGFSNFLLRVRPTKINPKLLYYFLSSNLTKQRIERMVSSTTYPNLKVDEYSNSEILVPPLQEQEQIVKYLDEKTSIIDKLISTKERKIELLKEQRSSLINEVITKGLDPNVKMKDSGVEWIGEIPESWEISKLKYNGSFFSGYSFDSGDFLSEGNIRVIKISNIQNNGISWDDLSFVPDDYYDRHQNFIVNKGDLIFVLTRPIISTGIKICFYNEDFKVLLNQRNSVFRSNPKKLDKYFTYYLVRTTYFLEEFKQQIKETNQPNISTEQISNIVMFLPPLQEQEQIVEYLDKHTKEIDDLLGLEQRKIELLKEYRQSLMSEVITGKIKVVE